MTTLTRTATGGYEVTMTMAEWKATHRDFKGKFDDGTRSVLWCIDGATTIVPVRIVKE